MKHKCECDDPTPARVTDEYSVCLHCKGYTKHEEWPELVGAIGAILTVLALIWMFAP